PAGSLPRAVRRGRRVGHRADDRRSSQLPDARGLRHAGELRPVLPAAPARRASTAPPPAQTPLPLRLRQLSRGHAAGPPPLAALANPSRLRRRPGAAPPLGRRLG